MTWRGGEQQVFYLTQSLSEMADKVQSWVFCAKGSVMEARCREAGLLHVAYVKGWSFNPFFAYQLATFCRTNGIDLLHLHDPHAHNLAILSADLFGNHCPMVLSRRVDFRLKNNRYTHYKYNHKAIQRIICVSEAIRRIMLPHIEQPQKLTVIYSGIDEQKFDRQGSNGHILRKQYGLDKHTALIGNVAALAPHKDYFTFLATAQRLLDGGMKAKFLLIGEGDERKNLQEYVQAKGLENDVIFTGFRNDIAQILPELDIMLVTSDEEGLGTSVLDAFAAGVPVVATQAGGLMELVLEGQTGLSAPIKNADLLAKQVTRLLTDPALRISLIKGAESYVQRFSRENTAQKTLSIYEEILSNARPILKRD